MSPLLRLDSLGRRFGGITALHDVSVEVAAGTCHAVIGPNGAGKTTLINLISGLLRPSSGTIRFDGHDITGLPAHVRARHGIGRTWQHPALFARLSVADNLTLACTHHDRNTARNLLPRRGARAARVTGLLDQSGLRAHATHPAGKLPYGLQRRLELAMALATGPRLLLLDEPSAGLDPQQLTDLTNLITDLHGEVTVLLVDHHLDLVWSLADTVTVLHHGQHLATGGPAQVRADPQVQAAYLTTTDQPTTTRPHRRPDNNTPAVLRVCDLSAGYHGEPVLDGIGLQVGDGEALAVLGRNGCGKTTLLNTIAGLLPAHTGRVELAGQPLADGRAHLRALAGMALVPQGRRLFAALTVTEHLVCARAAHRRAEHISDRPDWTIERVFSLLPALAVRAHQPARLLSGGEQQMLALARALVTNPRLLILDEPSEGLAPAVISQLAAILAELTADGLAVLVAEQNLALATAVADRVLLLHHGRIAMNCSSRQLHTPANQPHLHTLLGVAEPTREVRP